MRVVTFESAEDIFTEIQKARAEADANTEEWQRGIIPGHCFVRIVDCYGEPLAIYGEVIESPYEEDRELYKEPHMAGYRLSRCFSSMCPEGELGDTHISTMIALLSREQFEKARAAGWPSDKPGLAEVLRVPPS